MQKTKTSSGLKWPINKIKSNQIKSLLLSHHHSTSALVSEILWACSRQCKKNNNNSLHMDRQCKKNNKKIYIWTDQCKKTTAIYIWTDSAKKTTTIYIWTVHIYRLYRRQCAKYTYIYSVHIVYYKGHTQLSATHYTPYGHIYIMYTIYTLCSLYIVIMWGATDYKLTADWLSSR